MQKYKTLFTVIITFSLLLSSNVLATNNLIQAKITVNNQYFDDQTDITIEVTLTNVSKQPIKLLRWHLPKPKLDSNVFSITREGVEVNYEGKLIKRAAPKEQDYLQLNPNESYSSHVELSSTYDMRAAGSYEVQLHIGNLIANSQLSRNSVNSKTIHSNKVSFWAEGTGINAPISFIPDTNTINSDAGKLTTQACSNSQQSKIKRASNAAKNMSRNAYFYLTSNRIQSRYTTWFGNNNNSRRNRVKGNFSAISDALNNKPVTYDCSCNQNYYAYVYPGQPYKIYLCNAFWRAPNTGTDSKAGTIIHELSHFYIVASTRDHAYGHRAAKRLAKIDPNRAVRNADSHEYFAENTPYLP